MKNKNKSVYPANLAVHDTNDMGLTKRELFAMAAMQGLMANPSYNDINPLTIAKESITQADELLKQLEPII